MRLCAAGILSDQNPENDEYNYTDGWKIIKEKEDLDRWITRKTVVWHKAKDSYAGTLLWKLQR